MDYEGIKRLVFSLREPKKGCLVMNNAIKISIMNKGFSKDWDYEVKGSFSEKDCTINDRKGDVVAQVGGKGKMASKDFYEVEVQPGYDLAFVVGVIAVLDSIHAWRVNKVLRSKLIRKKIIIMSG
ncbi:Protein LURP-one-related 16 [Dendrobium catenatum]|uniref:Protein LURP-one-related 16 n=1 Tax=Dendrobium catenatum TaxID=906689 RepID=A0A2I0VNT9_9ASPA|nr:Protein LURP-one-related 16 [Dendrobium catenatum]